MPGEEENMSDEAIWETLPVSVSLVKFLLSSTTSGIKFPSSWAYR